MDTRPHAAKPFLKHLAMAFMATLTWQTAVAQEKDSQKARLPNAAVTYRAAIAEMKRALTDPKTGRLAIPNGNYSSPQAHLTEAWATIVKKSAVALTLFEQATATKPCRFADSARTCSWELSRALGSGSDYWTLVLIQRAQGWQLVEDDPRGACEIAFRLLDHSNHCARSKTVAGVQAHLSCDQLALELLQEAVGNLGSRNREKTVQWARKQLEKQRAERLDQAQIAKIAANEFRQVVERGYTDEVAYTRTKTFRAARAGAIAEVYKMLAPLRAKTPITSRDFDAQVDTFLQAACERAGDADFEDLIKAGKHEAIAANLVFMHASDSHGLGHSSERDQLLAACQQALAK